MANPPPDTHAEKTPSQIRKQLMQLVMKDLHGPFDGETEEVDQNRVSDRYLVGMLAPFKQKVLAETDDELAEAGTDSPEEGAAETAKGPVETMFPSSMGLTFTVSSEASALEVAVSWGRYDRVKSETLKTAKGNPTMVWKRFPEKGSVSSLDLEDGSIEPIPLNNKIPEIVLKGRIRKRDVGWVVTLFLVNGQAGVDKLSDTKWIFQPKLSVQSVDGAPVFIRRPTYHNKSQMDDNRLREITEMEMLYRHDVEFAVGHGVAVHAVTLKGNPQLASKLETAIVPRFELPMQLPPTKDDEGFAALDGLELDMAELAKLSPNELVTRLTPLTTAYKIWIEAEKARISDPNEGLAEHEKAMNLAMEKCERVLERIRDGIKMLSENQTAADAFRFANQAMYLQRIHTIHSERGTTRREK